MAKNSPCKFYDRVEYDFYVIIVSFWINPFFFSVNTKLFSKELLLFLTLELLFVSYSVTGYFGTPPWLAPAALRLLGHSDWPRPKLSVDTHFVGAPRPKHQMGCQVKGFQGQIFHVIVKLYGNPNLKRQDRSVFNYLNGIFGHYRSVRAFLRIRMEPRWRKSSFENLIPKWCIRAYFWSRKKL